jgi:hypothetical protein
MKLSIIIPAYNEYTNLHNNFYKIKKATEKITKDCEIIIAEDGSIDGTSELAEKFRKKIKKHKEVVHLHADKRLGRGKALNRAFKKAKGNIIVFMDADLATDLKDLPNLVKYINEGYDCVIGSRYMKESDTKRQLEREFVSIIYNNLVRILFNTKILDHQCGFKAFKKKSVMKIIDRVENKKWFWDTECIIRMEKAGDKIKEIPVKWRYPPTTKVNVIKDSWEMGTDLIKLWWELRI